ncbi:MAG TPA: hypothetical protein VGB79_08515 [Allosphingosinicella sp.]|jgi:hypothetical protein
MSSRTIFAAFAGLCLSTAAAAESLRAPLTEEAVQSLSTRQLAARLFGADVARQVQSHQVQGAGGMRPPGAPPTIQFYARATPAGARLCKRRTYFVSFERSGAALRPLPAGEGAQIAVAPGCRLAPSASFASVQPRAALQDAGEALLRLAAARDAARRGAVSRREVAICRSVAGADACAAGADAVLAALPVERAHIVAPADTPAGTWRIAVMPRGPGQPYWDVLLREPPGERIVIEMTWRVPAPF